jgi:hypothetical protein
MAPPLQLFSDHSRTIQSYLFQNRMPEPQVSRFRAA